MGLLRWLRWWCFLNGFAPVTIFFEWVCSGGSDDDFFWMSLLRWWFFLNRFAGLLRWWFFFEWVCSGGSDDDFFWMGLLRWWFFLNGFEWACSGDDFFDRWPGFQIGSVGFKLVIWVCWSVVGVVAVVGSNWFDGLCVWLCWWFMFVCVALLLVWCLCLCVWMWWWVWIG